MERMLLDIKGPLEESTYCTDSEVEGSTVHTIHSMVADLTALSDTKTGEKGNL